MLRVIVCLMVVLLVSPAWAQDPTPPVLPPPGLFLRTTGGNALPQAQQYGAAWFLLGGRGAHLSWCAMEPSPGVYDWTELDAYIVAWRAHGKLAIPGISLASSADGKFCPTEGPGTLRWTVVPPWLLMPPFAVPFIAAVQKGAPPEAPKEVAWPQYWHATLQTRWWQFVDALGAHLVQADLASSVPWIEVFPGREGSTGISRPDTFPDYVAAWAASPQARDYDQDGQVTATDFAEFWTRRAVNMLPTMATTLARHGLYGMVTLQEYEIPKRLPIDYLPLITRLATGAVTHGLLLGSKTLDDSAQTMLSKASTHVYPTIPPHPKALWNDFNVAPPVHTEADFQRNYRYAIGNIDGIPPQYSHWVYIAGPQEMDAAQARREQGDCPELVPPASGLCWPEVESTLGWLIEQLQMTPHP